MADEIRVTSQGAVPPRSADIVVNADPDAAVPADHAAHDPEDPSVARAQIERTRARMSETIDEIEEVLVRKKESIQDRLDFLSPVRERPFAATGVVFGAGLLLGLITGGNEGGARASYHDDDLEMRAETWERRARRLLRIAREQEDELEALSARRGGSPAGEAWNDKEEVERHTASDPSRLGSLGDEIAERVTGYLTDAIQGLFGGRPSPG